MSEQSHHEATFVQNLSLIDRVAMSVARRQGLSGEDAADLASWVKLKLVEDEYAVFQKFRGESSISTYLAVVIAMLARDYRVQRWGRWRPSAVARRHGTVAVRLETLVHRQGYRLQHAAELLRTAGETTLSDGELARLLSALPARQPLRPVEVGAEALGQVEARAGADAAVESEAAEIERQETEGALQRIIEGLSCEDRMIVRMRFWENLSVADIARGLNLDQRALYRRIERLLALLRARLTQQGVTQERLHDLLEGSSP
jgi:RNA polymerase sigma factor for flagellar operon FliA